MKTLLASLALLPVIVWGQIENDPRWQRFQEGRRMQAAYSAASNPGVVWSPDSQSYSVMEQGKRVWYAVKTGQPASAPAPAASEPVLVSRGGRPIVSPNGEYRLTAGRTLTVERVSGGDKVVHASVDSGNAKIRAGSVPWVYGEELEQSAGMGWAPSGTRFWFYRFDSTPVQPYYLTSSQLDLQSNLMELDYPKAGTANHLVELWVGDAAARTFQKVDSAPLNNVEYLFDIRWLNKEQLMYLRMDRRQHQREIAIFDAAAVETRVAHVEQSPNGFIPYQWRPRQIGDWLYFATDLNGFANWSRIAIKTGKREDLTSHPFDVEFTGLDFAGSDFMIYRARGGQNPLASQLYRYDFKSKKSTRLTNPELHHRTSVSPNGQYFVTAGQLPSQAPESALFEATAGEAKLIRKLNPSPVPLLPAPARELFEFTSADGRTKLSGTIAYPRGFDPAAKYPVLFDVYGGPEQSDVNLNFAPYEAQTELGFLVVKAETRGGLHRGSAFRNAAYLNLGIVEMDDFAACAKVLRQRPYVNAERMGMYGTSYGGYAALMALVRYPDIWSAASSSCPPTDWRNYDTIYTERYMGLPKETKANYDAGNVLTYVKDLKGELQLYFGTSDDNVHPSNSLQLIRLLESQGKEYELRVGPDRGHSYVGDRAMVRFFWNAFKMR